jgi:hypothetical protein
MSGFDVVLFLFLHFILSLMLWKTRPLMTEPPVSLTNYEFSLRPRLLSDTYNPFGVIVCVSRGGFFPFNACIIYCYNGRQIQIHI